MDGVRGQPRGRGRGRGVHVDDLRRGNMEGAVNSLLLGVYQVCWGRISSCEERKRLSWLWGRI